MPRVVAILALLALAFSPAFLLSPAQASDAEALNASDGTSLEVQTFALINEYRRAHDFPALVWSGAIAKVARAHSKDMAVGDVDFGHDGFGGRITRLKSALPGLQGAGENVLMTDNPDEVARRAVDLWLRSPHHLENIRGNYDHSGLGIWKNDKGEIYLTQIFVKIVPPAAQTRETSSPEVITSFGLLAAPKAPRSP